MVHELTKQTLEDLIKKNSIIIIDFYATWCAPCKTFATTFSEVSEFMNDNATFGKINIDEQRDMAVEYKVTSIPTVAIIKDGELVWQHTGSLSSQELTKKISSIL